jgi:hypothetical protein
MPIWMVSTYAKMLGPLTAGRQLLAIEAASVPRMKPEAAGQVINRYRSRFLREKRKSTVEQLMAAFPVRKVPTSKKESH